MAWTSAFVDEPFPYLELALVALAEIPEADAEGVFPLDWTQYDMMNEGTEHSEFLVSPIPPNPLRAEFRISPNFKNIQPRKSEIHIPKTSASASAFPSPFELAH